MKIAPLGLALLEIFIHVALHLHEMGRSLIINDCQVRTEQAAIRQRGLRSFLHALENELLAEPRLNMLLLEKMFERVESYLETNDAYQQHLIDQLSKLLVVYDKLVKEESEYYVTN